MLFKKQSHAADVWGSGALRSYLVVLGLRLSKKKRRHTFPPCEGDEVKLKPGSFCLERQKSSGTRQRWWLHTIVNMLTVTERCTLK